jgi:hypothetical protein
MSPIITQTRRSQMIPICARRQGRTNRLDAAQIGGSPRTARQASAVTLSDGTSKVRRCRIVEYGPEMACDPRDTCALRSSGPAYLADSPDELGMA